MKILALDTTTKFLCLGLYDNGKVYEYNLKAGTLLSSLLGITLKRVLDALGWKVSDIDYFACGLGPGSFTGIRVGMSAIKGLAFSVNKPVVGVPTLDILAANAAKRKGYISPVVDAKRKLIYTATYKQDRGKLKRVSAYRLLGIDEFLKKSGKNTLLLGDALGIYRGEILNSAKGLRLLDSDYWYPQAHNIVNLARERIKQKKISDAFRIKPIYLYPKECQIRNEK